MASRNAAFKELVQGRRKSSEMMSPLPPDAGLAEPEEQQPSCSKAAKKKKKKRPQDEDDHEQGGAEVEPKATRAKSRSHDSKAELKKKDLEQQKQGLDGADKKAESFIDQAGTSAAFSRVQTDEDYAMSKTPTGLSTSSLDSSASKKVVTDIWINPKETVSWNLDSLVTLNVLGRGSFGIVYLVRHRVNRQLAALKYIRKKNQNPEKERKRVEVEKSVWEAVTDHPYVVTFRAYFETAKGWCFVMEYLPEGSIRDLVRKKGPFKEETARLLSAQVALAIQHVHEKGFLHRDISSSNVLIDSRGNAKLIDFGLSQIGTEAWCRCGSLAYMAPEVIRQELYGMSADWWSFGIVLFVMLVGKTPLAIYAAEKGVDLHLARRDIRYRLALIAPLKIPRTLSRSAQTLLREILKENPKRRLGCRPEGGFDDLMKNPFYAPIDWSEVSCGSLPSTTREEGSNLST
ncbi:protein kinase C iota type-like isoform X1 [Dermacentor andersoni]|uniref:protein kinase C iota type-like isoform X1 n=1 Tax=Dermacentor andersoni TaxID=34620 RepID=UPI002417B961|nr:protein kinase C iota type-like isoform X1 [Dermacentor andersoni]